MPSSTSKAHSMAQSMLSTTFMLSILTMNSAAPDCLHVQPTALKYATSLWVAILLLRVA